MKKLFLLLALMGMVVVGCSKDEVDKGNHNDIPENIFFELDKESIAISPNGGSVDVIVYSNYKWEISGTSDWCTPSVNGGVANEDGQKVTFSADVAYDDREATFWFRCANEKIKFVVTQKLKAVIIPDANNSFNIPAEGGVAVISYQTSVDCEVIIPEEAQDWITIAPATRGLVSENINLDIAENMTYSARTTTIIVVAKNNAELVVEYTINQAQNDAILADENNVFTVPSAGGEVVIKYQTNVDCEVIIPEEAQDWITIAPATRGLVAYNTTLNIAANYSNKQRSCVVKVVSRDYNELFAEYPITQNPRCFLYYTSSNGKVVEPHSSTAFGATILSNTYKDGVGIIEFNAPITEIGEYAFSGCSSLTSVTIGDSVTTIGKRAFEYCSSLTSVTIPDSVTTIGGYAFINCSSLTSITIPDSVNTIGEGAFLWCESLTTVTIGDSVTAIGGSAFMGCSSLTSVTIPDSVTTIGGSAFSYCSSLTSVTIGDSVTTIGGFAFSRCSSLISITIPDSVTAIGEGAFCNCSSLREFNGKYVSDNGRCLIIDGTLNSFAPAGLTEYTIPDSVTTIGFGAVYGYYNLTSVTIPDSVTTIGCTAFNGCSSLTSVYCKATTPPTAVLSYGSWNAFNDNASGRKIYVPMQSVETYKSASYWSDYADSIVGYNF